MKKKLLVALMLMMAMALALCSCGNSSEEATDEGNVLAPLESAFDMETLQDCTANVSFTADDFDWELNCVYVTLFDTLCYDAVAVSELAEGDTIVTASGDVVVETLKDTDNGKLINEGTANEVNLCTTDEDGGVYQIVGENDVVEMQAVGQAQITLADDVVLNDSTDEPGETVTVKAGDLKAYIEGLDESRQTFSELDTTIVLTGEKASEITRAWRP